MAFIDAIPYVAFAGAGLLVAFVGGEYALKKWQARNVKKPAPVVPDESGRGLVSKPSPLASVRAAASAPLPAAEADANLAPASERVPLASERVPLPSDRAPLIDTPVAQDSGSNEPVEVFDESESVRIAEVAMLHVSGGDSGRIPELSPVSGRGFAVNMAAEVVAEVEDAPSYVSGADTERCPAISSEEVRAAAEAGLEDLEVEGVVCTDVIAARRDPSVRVFDAVVAPSERKSTAA